jgi:uncharacterized protein YndB with AHSA1/START domain
LTWTALPRALRTPLDGVAAARIAFESMMAMGEHGRRRGGRDFSTSIVVTFEERDGKTLLTIVQSGFEERVDRDNAKDDGWGKILDALERVVADRTAR